MSRRIRFAPAPLALAVSAALMPLASADSDPVSAAMPDALASAAWPYVVTIGGRKAEAFVTRRGSQYILTADDARRFGARPDLSGEVALENVRDDPFSLTLTADLPLDALAPTRIGRAGGTGDSDILPQRLGGWLNYTADGRHTDAGTSYSVLADLNLSLPRGIVRHQQILGSGAVESRRLMTAYQLDLPERRLSLIVGDAYSASYAHGAGARFAGLQIRRNYALDPNYIYWPSLDLTGTARAPSTYEIFEGNRRVSGGTLERGEFAIEDYTSFVGESGQVKMIVRDAQGNEQVIAQDLYTAPNALKPGEFAYGLDLGIAYELDDRLSDDLYASAALRYGLSRLTLEGGADVLGDDVSGFAGVIWPSRWGAWSYRRIQGDRDGASRTIDRGSWEKTVSFAAEREWRLYATAERVDGREAERDISDLNLQAGISYTHGDWSLFATTMRYADTSTHAIGGNWTLRTVSIGGSLAYSDDTGMIAGIQVSIPFGNLNVRASASDDRSGFGVNGAARDWAWSASIADAQGDTEAYGSLRRDFARARGEVYIDHRRGTTGYRGRALGSIVFAPEGIAFARPVVSSSVVLVETGLPGGVPIRVGGRTHTAAIGGKTVVTNAIGYGPTTIQPDFDRLDGGYTADIDRRQVRAPHGLSEIAFQVRAPGFFARLTHRGQPIERGIQVQADGQPVLVTSAGAYIQPPAGATVTEIAVGECRTTIQVPKTALASIEIEVCPTASSTPAASSSDEEIAANQQRQRGTTHHAQL